MLSFVHLRWNQISLKQSYKQSVVVTYKRRMVFTLMIIMWQQIWLNLIKLKQNRPNRQELLINK